MTKRGRPFLLDQRLKKIQIGLKLPIWLIAWLDQQSESRAALIEAALRRRHKLKPPTTIS